MKLLTRRESTQNAQAPIALAGPPPAWISAGSIDLIAQNAQAPTPAPAPAPAQAQAPTQTQTQAPSHTRAPFCHSAAKRRNLRFARVPFAALRNHALSKRPYAPTTYAPRRAFAKA